MKVLPLLLGALSVLAGMSSESRAYPVDRRLFQLSYQQTTRCELCHSHGGGTERNGFGQAWRRAGEDLAAFRAIERQDSDGDTFSNIHEIRGGSNPGDPRSTPDNPGSRWKRNAEIPIPSDQLVLVLGPTDRIEAVEPSLSPEQVRGIESAIRRKLNDEERVPTIYFAVKDSKRRALALFVHAQAPGERYSILISVGPDGRILKAVMFRAGGESPSAYQDLLGCLSGKGRDELTDSSRGCTGSSRRRPQGTAIVTSVRTGLLTVAALFSKRDASAGVP